MARVWYVRQERGAESALAAIPLVDADAGRDLAPMGLCQPCPAAGVVCRRRAFQFSGDFAREFRRDPWGRRSFLGSSRAGCAQKARRFWPIGYTSVAAARDMGAHEREAILSQANVGHDYSRD